TNQRIPITIMVMERLKTSKRKRPLLASKADEEMLDFVREHLRQRNIFYSQAHILFKGESMKIDDLVQKINEKR
ncbi:MAG TPA: hypothetical protein PK939_09350, partial [Bacteroidales bacterium]|nr:hypothetical protein [Bacteroidales bacterium]